MTGSACRRSGWRCCWLVLAGAGNQRHVAEVVVVPLLFLWWAAQVLYQIIPQALLWGVFVVTRRAAGGEKLPPSSAPLLPAAIAG